MEDYVGQPDGEETGKPCSSGRHAGGENGQYNEDWRYIHTLPAQLPMAVHDLDATAALPVHNSKFALSRHAWDEPARKIEEAAARDSSLHIVHAIIGKPIAY